MPSLKGEFFTAIELHSVERLRAVLDAGFDPRVRIDDKTPVNWLTEMYGRSAQLSACLQVLLDHGAVLDDPLTAPVLLNDAAALKSGIQANPSLLAHRTTLVCSFTPLVGASLLHVAVEYGNLEAARVLIESGADVNARAAVDENGFNGHTPLFHAVNQNPRQTTDMLRLLLAAGAKTDVWLPGLVWGRGFEWETTFFDITPLSYAQMGLTSQMHRRELEIYENIKLLLAAAHRPVPPLRNVPNRYLQPKPKS